MERSGAERGAGGRGAATKRGAGVTEIGWRAERFFVAHIIWTLFIQYCVYGVVFLMYGTLGAYSSSRICCGTLSVSVQ